MKELLTRIQGYSFVFFIRDFNYRYSFRIAFGKIDQSPRPGPCTTLICTFCVELHVKKSCGNHGNPNVGTKLETNVDLDEIGIYLKESKLASGSVSFPYPNRVCVFRSRWSRSTGKSF